jgi:hypothetical protein
VLRSPSKPWPARLGSPEPSRPGRPTYLLAVTTNSPSLQAEIARYVAGAPPLVVDRHETVGGDQAGSRAAKTL